MPIYSRSQLRRGLGQDWVRDVRVSSTTHASWGASGSVSIIDNLLADASLTGQSLHQRSWVKVNAMELRVASFNALSGALFSMMVTGTQVPSGTEYEQHSVLSPTEKDRCLDAAFGRIRVEQEVGIPSVDGLTAYSLNGAASPHRVVDVQDVYYFADPTNTGNRDQRALTHWEPVLTATGWELRIDPALGVSQQLVISAILELSLGSGDAATVNIPDARWVLSAAAVDAFDRLVKRGPGQEVTEYRKLRTEAARVFSDLTAVHGPQLDKQVQMDDAYWVSTQ